jgi:hypothetical protein
MADRHLKSPEFDFYIGRLVSRVKTFSKKVPDSMWKGYVKRKVTSCNDYFYYCVLKILKEETYPHYIRQKLIL